MSSIRVRPPSDDGRWTIEWYAAMGDGVWVLLHGGRIFSMHDYKWQARLARRRAVREGA